MSTGNGWTIVVVDDPAQIPEHPLGRTLFVHPVADLAEVRRYITPRTQTLCCEPWVLGQEHRDAWGSAGVDRIVELGMSRRPQYGYAHDGMHPLSKLVRWVTLEAGIHEFYRYNEYTRQVAEDRLFPWHEAAPGQLEAM
jgi:long-chain-fatty-acyl-CoA reductase